METAALLAAENVGTLGAATLVATKLNFFAVDKISVDVGKSPQARTCKTSLVAKGLLKVLPNGVEINVIGVKNEENELSDLIESENLSDTIFLQGFSNDTSVWLRSAHFYLSTSRWEGLPISVLEASSNGLPVIATDVVGNRDAVENGKTGILFPLEEPEKAVEAILSLIQNAALYNQFSTDGRNLIKQKFSVSEMVRKTEELYFKLLE